MARPSKSTRNQQHSQSLITVTVGPGSETGLYYILIANLSHSTTGKELKAFAAQACEVDHAEVYTPTSGFVRVIGLENFEKAFKHLNGNTLEYRSLQADARNKTRSTVVKLPLTDYHAQRILRGDTGRVFSEPSSPTPDTSVQAEPLPPDTGPGSSSSTDYHRGGSPAFGMSPPASTRWGYPATSLYPPAGGFQGVVAPRPVAYHAVADTAHSLSQLTIGLGYHAATGPTAGAAQYPYGTSVPYSPPGTGHGIATQGYTTYTDLPSPDPSPTGPAYTLPYGGAWLPDATQAAPHPGQIIHYGNGEAGVVGEKRTIVIMDPDRDGLPEARVVGLLAEYAGIGWIGPGGSQIECIHLVTNRDGRPRGIAFVTFYMAELASAAVAVLDGRMVDGRVLTAKLAAEGEPSGGRFGIRPGRRTVKSSAGRRDAAGPAQAKASSQALSAQAVAGVEPGPLPGPEPGTGVPAAPGLGVASSSASLSAGSDGLDKKREDRPVIVDGSVKRWKKEEPPVVVNGSSDRGRGGHHRGSTL